MMKYKNSIYYIYYIFFKLNDQPFPHITAKEYNLILNVFNIVSSIYNRYKPKGRKSLIILGKVKCAKYIPSLKTHSKQKKLERAWELITKDSEWFVTLRKRKIV